jgi:hypothetical protein
LVVDDISASRLTAVANTVPEVDIASFAKASSGAVRAAFDATSIIPSLSVDFVDTFILAFLVNINTNSTHRNQPHMRPFPLAELGNRYLHYFVQILNGQNCRQ